MSNKNMPELLPLKELSEFDTLAKCHKEIDRLRGLAFVWPYGNPPFPWKLVAEDTPSIVTEPDYETRLRDEVTLRFIKIMPTLHPKPYIHHEEFARRVHGFTDAFMAERKKRMQN